MPRVMRCRQFQWNDRSKGIGLCGRWWVSKMPCLRPNPTVPKGITMPVASMDVTTISAVVSMTSSPRAGVSRTHRT